MYFHVCFVNINSSNWKYLKWQKWNVSYVELKMIIFCAHILPFIHWVTERKENLKQKKNKFQVKFPLSCISLSIVFVLRMIQGDGNVVLSFILLSFLHVCFKVLSVYMSFIHNLSLQCAYWDILSYQMPKNYIPSVNHCDIYRKKVQNKKRMKFVVFFLQIKFDCLSAYRTIAAINKNNNNNNK